VFTDDISHKCDGRLLLISAMPAVTFPSNNKPPWPVPHYTASLLSDRGTQL